MKIMQTADEIVFLFEGGLHIFRIIPTDGRPHKPDPWTWYGDSIGRWEGDTLVIDVVGFNDKSWLDSSGYPHGEKLHLSERFRKTTPRRCVTRSPSTIPSTTHVPGRRRGTTG